MSQFTECMIWLGSAGALLAGLGIWTLYFYVRQKVERVSLLAKYVQINEKEVFDLGGHHYIRLDNGSFLELR